MSQFNTVRSAKAASDLEARLRRNKLLHGRSAFQGASRPATDLSVASTKLRLMHASTSRKLPGARNERVGFSNSTEESIK